MFLKSKKGGKWQRGELCMHNSEKKNKSLNIIWESLKSVRVIFLQKKVQK